QLLGTDHVVAGLRQLAIRVVRDGAGGDEYEHGHADGNADDGSGSLHCFCPEGSIPGPYSNKLRRRASTRAQPIAEGIVLHHRKSKRSRFMTFVHAAAKSSANFRFASELP